MIGKNIKRIWPYLKKSKTKLILYAINSIFDALIYSLVPIVGAKIILNVTNGKVIDSGTHEYLIKNCKTCLELYKKDLNN